MRHLLLTLGHNSSAILIQDGKLMGGYEEERLSTAKSDSRFPVKAIQQLLGQEQPDAVYVTHWEPTSELERMSRKHWDPMYFDGIPIRSHTDNTHHDTHAAAALAFAGPHFPRNYSYLFVVDGFGSFGEHFSVYRINPNSGVELVFRARGYDTSLGLLYQYATAFMGLKMHEDEYKLLGYEVHVAPHHVRALQPHIKQAVETWLTITAMPHLGSVYDPVFNLAALNAVREEFFKVFGGLMKFLGLVDPTSFEARAALAYYVQSVLEECVLSILNRYDIENLIVSGGCFYNVKLNKVLLGQIDGQFCAFPLAGDQGNALGLYAMDYPSFVMPNHLFWGHRQLKDMGQVDGLEYISSHDVTDAVLDRIQTCGFVNLVRGSMEFGPRALCNTSTLAVPNPETVQIINQANNRNTVMPMAPVMTRSQWSSLYHNCKHVWKSEEYMILAMEHVGSSHQNMQGAAHQYSAPFTDHWTGRPQVISPKDADMVTILEEMGPLINTSFNYHGMPIAYDMPSIIANHMLQYSRNPDFRTLVVIN